MSAPAPSPPDDPRARRLLFIAEVLEAAHHRSPDRRASLVQVRKSSTDAFELALQSVDGADLYEMMLGSTVPDEFDAAGFVVRGTARSMGDPDRDLGPGERLGRACSAVLCARDGTVASVLRVDDDPVVREVARDPASRSGVEGRFLDVLRRSLGLSTCPADVPVAALRTHLWLHRVLERAVDHGAPDQASAEALFPDVPDSWDELRRQHLAGCWSELDLDRGLVAWMDTGMFARVCLAGFAEPLEVMIELSELLAPEVWSHLVARLCDSSAGESTGADSLAPRAC